MRKIVAVTLIVLSVLLITALPAMAAETPGTVTISYDLTRLPAIASNQLAVWIEDSGGRFVKTLFVTWFTGKGGYERRPDCLPLWRKAAGVDGPPIADVDAVTQATQQPGRRLLVWNCTDAAGQPVPPGQYVYKIEGNLFWAKEVVWTGEIMVGASPATSRARAQGEETMVANVTASFAPVVH